MQGGGDASSATSFTQMPLAHAQSFSAPPPGAGAGALPPGFPPATANGGPGYLQPQFGDTMQPVYQYQMPAAVAQPHYLQPPPHTAHLNRHGAAQGGRICP